MPVASVSVSSSVRLHGYFWAENDVFELGVSAYAKLTLLYLKRRADSEAASFPCVRTIAKAISASIRSVYRALEELVRLGAVTVLSGKRKGEPNHYTVQSVRATQAQGPPEVRQSDIGGLPERHTEGIPNEGIPKEPLTASSGKPDVAHNGSARSKPEYDLLDFLNRKAGRRFQPLEANLRLIRARLREATVEQIRAVIGLRCRRWGADAKMSEFLRPATLFNATNFAQYLGELPASAFSPEEEPDAD